MSTRIELWRTCATGKTGAMTEVRYRHWVDRQSVVRTGSGRSWEFVVPIPARKVTYKDHNTNVQACKNHKLMYIKIKKERKKDIRKIKKR